ncbi:MAG: stage V sporulation protein AE [Clostridia bacterium]|jgi:stage V sporulation protein AE|nr:stage V sporulation protein AE [Clostridia bacterium]MDH7572699.1 stage V sporulation protein AE [Clostridia bacterium]
MLLKAFLLGGLICLIGQLIMDLTPFNVTTGHVLVGFVTAGAVLSALGWYQPLVDFGGAGATIPLSGFGHSLTQGTLKAMESQGLLGIFTGGLASTSAGIAAAVIFGYVMAVLFRPQG